MGTLLRARVAAAERATAIRAIEAAFDRIRRVEARLSTWRPETELTAVNRAALERPVPVSPELAVLLGEVAGWSRRTGGALDPGVGALIDAYDLRGAGRTPDEAELRRALAATGIRCFDLDAKARTVTRRCAAGWLDAGAFGKGAALREARRSLEASGALDALFDFGGQLLAWSAPVTNAQPAGAAPGGTIGIAHPARRHEVAAWIRLPAGSAATSGQSERGAPSVRGRIGHVLDPRTGRPVPRWGSVTVVAEDPLVADVLSTALFVMGPTQGLAWLHGREEIAALFLVERNGRLEHRANAAMQQLVETRGEGK